MKEYINNKNIIMTCVVIFIIVFMFTYCGKKETVSQTTSTPTKKITSSWYDYGNGSINLQNVNNIHSEMWILYTNDKVSEVLSDDLSINESNISDIINKLSKIDYDPKNDVINAAASIYFDDFKLVLSYSDKNCNPKEVYNRLQMWLKVMNHVKAIRDYSQK